MHHPRRVQVGTRKRLHRIDSAYHMVHKLGMVRITEFLGQLKDELGFGERAGAADADHKADDGSSIRC